MLKWYIVLLVAFGFGASPALTQTTVTLQTGQTVEVMVETMQIYVPPQCKPKFCDSADIDCDGTLDTVCPGLTYNVCVDGSIVDAYIESALTGFCIQPEPEPECGGLVVSPAVPCEDM